MKKKSSTSEIAKRYGVTARTVRNWKTEGAPVSDPKRLSAWLAARRQPPRFPTKATGPVKNAEPATIQLAEVEYKPGAVAALKRLETQEVEAYRRLQRALSKGDELEIRLARSDWNRASDALRKYDLAIEVARRGSGELVPREHMENLCHELNEAMYFGLLALQDVSPSLAGLNSPHDVWNLLGRLRDTVRAGVLARLQRPLKNPLPDWMIKAVRTDANSLPKETDDGCVQFWFVLREAMATHAQEARAAFDKAKQLKGQLNEKHTLPQT